MIIFGGKLDEGRTAHQYSVVKNCGLESKEQLPFEFDYGTCHDYYQD